MKFLVRKLYVNSTRGKLGDPVTITFVVKGKHIELEAGKDCERISKRWQIEDCGTQAFYSM